MFSLDCVGFRECFIVVRRGDISPGLSAARERAAIYSTVLLFIDCSAHCPW